MLESPDGLFRTLDVGTCLNLAIQASPGANALDQEAARYRRTQSGSNVIAEVLQRQAMQARNDHAADALTAWFNLLKTGLQQDVLRESSEQVETTRETVNRLRDKGLAMEADLGRFDREQGTLRDQQLELGAAQQKLTAVLELVLHLETDPAHPVVAAPTGLESWRPCEAPETEAAVCVAWSQRQDLAILEQLAGTSDLQTLELARQSLAAVHPLIAAAVRRNFATGPIRKLRLKRELEQELADRKSQLQEVIQQTRGKIRVEVEEALASIARHEEGIRLRQESLASVQRSLELLDQTAGVRQVQLEEQTSLHEQRLQLESELVEQLIQRELAWVRLLKSQGLLGTGCTVPPGSLPFEQGFAKLLLE